MRRLREVRIATQPNRAEPGGTAQGDAFIKFLVSAFMRRAVAGTIDQPQDFPRVGQADDQRVISPLAFVGDVDSQFALAVGFHDRPIGVEDGLFEERGRLTGPDLPPGDVDRLLQFPQVLRLEAAAEVTRRGGIRNPEGAQRVQIGFVLPPQFEILQAPRVAQRVIRNVQHVVGFVIGQMNLEQVQPLIDGRRQAK